MKSQKKRKQEIVKATKAKEKPRRDIGTTINTAYEDDAAGQVEVIMPYKKGDYFCPRNPPSIRQLIIYERFFFMFQA